MIYQNNGLQQLVDEQNRKLREFDFKLSSARLISRDVVYKIILICSSIVGFSLTLASFQDLGIHININTLKISWYLFLTTIILGFLSIFIEGRLHYSLQWKSFQVQDFDKNYSYPLKDKLLVWFVSMYSLISPRNLVFCRIYPTKKKRKYYALLNAKTVQILAEIEKLTFIIENVFVITFVIALIVFVRSYS